MANWFAALPVAPGEWFAPLISDAPESVRVFHPLDVHITVAFLGRVGEERALAAWETVNVESCPTIEVVLDKLEAFGNPRRPSALSVTLAQGKDEVIALIERLRGPMIAAAGARPDTRPPRPHITVARPARAANTAARKRAVAWAQGKPAVTAHVVIDRLALYTWNEDRRARQFQSVRERALAP
jgi:2'-5' RNA ligase